jgi:hypothetical protein
VALIQVIPASPNSPPYLEIRLDQEDAEAHETDVPRSL